MPKPIVLKVLTAGEGGVGKTTLLHRYIDGKFSAETRMTIGVEFFLQELNVDGRDVVLQLWDFGGQERFRFLLKNYVLGAKGALLMFDLTRPLTLENLDVWVDIVREYDSDLPILFVGTKLDLIDQIHVDEEYILKLQENFTMFDYIKISSKTGENVKASFEILTKKVLERLNL